MRADLQAAQAENQRRRDERNRLKGAQGRPTVQSTPPPPPPTDHAADQERRRPKAWSNGRHTDGLRIDREPGVAVDPARLPPEAECPGDADVVVQDLLGRTDTVLCPQAKWASPSPHQPDLAALPPGDHGQFGPGIKRLALAWYCGAQMSAPQVAARWRHVGGHRSDGPLSNRLINDQAACHAATAARDHAGLVSRPGPHLDDTSPRGHGPNGYGHSVGTPR